MTEKRLQFGFTLMETLVVLAVVLILAGSLLGVGKFLTVRAQAQLGASQLEVISTALEQYYQQYETFPVVDLTAGYAWADLGLSLGGAVVPETDLPPDGASSAALYYFLDRCVNSRKIIDAVSGDLVTNKDSSGADMKIDLGSEVKDLPRFVDPWGRSVRYEYAAGWAFPKLTSAGPDGKFETTEDNLTSP